MANRRRSKTSRAIKITLSVFNGLFFACGMVLIAFGLILHFSRPASPGLPEAVSTLDLTTGFCILLTSLGIITAVISFTGFCGAARESRCLLGCYIGFLVTLILTEIALWLCITLFAASFLESLRMVGTLAVRESFLFNDSSVSESSSEAEFTIFMSELQHLTGCCGMNGYGDYLYSNYYNDSLTASLNNTNKCNVPKSCCVVGVNSTASDPQPVNYTACCLTWPPAPTSFHDYGCYWKALDNGLGNWSTIVAVTVGAIGIFEILVLVAALLLVCTFRDG